MVNVFDVAKYILNEKGPMTTMKLQKLAYYSQAWSLAWDGTPLFGEDFQAWANGPVCPELFNSHRGYFSLPQNFYDDRGDITKLNNRDKKKINTVLDFYADKDPQWLSNLTHQERPWREAREGIAPGERCDRVISKEIMQDYYAGL